jgi:hypothetical protein
MARQGKGGLFRLAWWQNVRARAMASKAAIRQWWRRGDGWVYLGSGQGKSMAFA